MDAKAKTIIICDFEIFQCFWCVTFAIPNENRIVQIWDDTDLLRSFYEEYPDSVYVGYNIRMYDQYIFKALLLDMDAWRVNQYIITYKEPGWKYSDALRKISLNIFDCIDGYRSLKELESFMGDDIRESNVPFNIARSLTDDEIQSVLFYNRHDVLETAKVFMHNHLLKKPNDMKPLLDLVNMYGLPLSDISKTSAQLTTKILGAVRHEYNDHFDIFIPDNIMIDKYRFVVDWYKDPSNAGNNKYLSCEIAGMKCQFGWGGVHGSKDGIIRKDAAIIDADVASLYPNIMIHYDLLSRSIPPSGKERFKDIVKTRLEAKSKGDKNTANALKICINSLYGVSRDYKSPVYDPRNGTSVCVVGQLLLLDYVEHLERIPSVEFFQMNTDGVFFSYDDTDETFAMIDDATREWEKRTRLIMEFEDYRSIYQANVNNYIAIASDGKIHAKGIFFKEKNALDNDYPIVREALFEYVVNDVIPENTINRCNELSKFMHTVKLSGNYEYVTTKVKTIGRRTYGDPSGKIDLKTFRIFASTDITKPSLYKVKKDNSAGRWGDTPNNIIIWNDTVKGVPCPDDLDRDFYINLVYKRAEIIKNPMKMIS